MPLRLSFIIPCNLMLDTLMIKAPTPFTIALTQTLNQTYNALHYRELYAWSEIGGMHHLMKQTRVMYALR